MTRRSIACAFATCSALLLTLSPAAGQVTDLTCFAINDRAAKGKFEARLGSEAGGATCKVKMPAKVACLRTTGTSTTPPIQSEGALPASVLCYQAKCTPNTMGTMQFADALGSHPVRFKTGKLLCLSATVTGSGPAPTTTTTLPTGCRFTDGACRGSCGGGMHCGAVVGTAECECQSVACGNADAPECSGFCADPDEACVFNVTGCGCVRIP